VLFVALNVAGSGVVVYNHLKLKALKAKVAKEGDSKGDDDEAPRSGHGDLQRPLLPSSINRSKDDIMNEIRRLQSEMKTIDGRVAGAGPDVTGLAGTEGMNNGIAGGGVKTAMDANSTRTGLSLQKDL
jgi:hypothetical protein